MDMMRMTLAAMGLDADALIAQATQLGETFGAVVRMQQETIARLKQVQASLDMMAAAMGLTVPPPEGDTLAKIEAETLAYLGRYGGHYDEPLVVVSDGDIETDGSRDHPDEVPRPRKRLRLLRGKAS